VRCILPICLCMCYIYLYWLYISVFTRLRVDGIYSSVPIIYVCNIRVQFNKRTSGTFFLTLKIKYLMKTRLLPRPRLVYRYSAYIIIYYTYYVLRGPISSKNNNANNGNVLFLYQLDCILYHYIAYTAHL